MFGATHCSVSKYSIGGLALIPISLDSHLSIARNMTQVLVDDTDPNIQYSGPWFLTQNALDTGTNGPPFQNTLHGVNVNASFSYSFSGMSR